jgi:hypothetical protein
LPLAVFERNRILEPVLRIQIFQTGRAGGGLEGSMDTAGEATMRDADYYRAQSEFCMDMAEAIKRPDYQDRWLRLAQHWRELAEQVDEERKGVSVGGLVR